MAFAESAMIQGTFTVSSTLPSVANINCGFIPTRVELINRSKIGDSSANLNWERVVWNTDFGSTNNYVEWHTASSTAMNVSNVTSNGISAYDGKNSIQLGAQVSGTVITKANPAVCTATSHGLQSGDVILMTQNSVMQQLSGMYFTVTVSDANTFTIPVNTTVANFTQETSFRFRKVVVGPLYYPQRAFISNITAANPMVITTTQAHGLTVGQKVRIRVPTTFGMTEANNLTGVITAVTSTTMTIGALDSSAFTAWAWPAASAVPFTPAFVMPIGSGPSPSTFGLVTYYQDNIDDATLNQQFQGFTVGTGLLKTADGSTVGLQASDVISYTAWRADV